jgi:hypothetical protein
VRGSTHRLDLAAGMNNRFAAAIRRTKGAKSAPDILYLLPKCCLRARSDKTAGAHLRRNGPSTWTFTGGDERTRTADPLLAKQVLYQLSYVPLGTPAETSSHDLGRHPGSGWTSEHLTNGAEMRAADTSVSTGQV